MITYENNLVEENKDEITKFEDEEPVDLKIVRNSKTPIKIKENNVADINEDEINELEDVEPIKLKTKKATKNLRNHLLISLNMTLISLSNLEKEINYPNEVRIRIFP
jgi:dsDNA-specific endonuclease/ATPase MutS2